MDNETLTILLPAITTIAVSVVLPLCMAGLALLQWWLSKKQEVAAKNAEAAAHSAEVKVEEVKTDLKASTEKADAKTEAIAEVLHDVHVLVNSNMAAQLKINTVALKRVADLTKHPDDVEAFNIAQKLYRDHEAKQSVVDARKESP